MNIDLLLSQPGPMGLVSDRNFPEPVAGVAFDAQTGQMTLEFAVAEPLEMNIPVEQDFSERILMLAEMYIGTIQNGVISDSRRVPVMLLNDPFGGGNTGHFAVKPGKALGAFEYFLKRCVAGQPLHRDDLGDEGSAGGVMGGMNPAILQFSPQLARQRAMEMAQRAMPTAAPSAPGFGPKGVGGSTMGGARGPYGSAPPPAQRRPPSSAPSSDDDEQF